MRQGKNILPVCTGYDDACFISRSWWPLEQSHLLLCFHYFFSDASILYAFENANGEKINNLRCVWNLSSHEIPEWFTNTGHSLMLMGEAESSKPSLLLYVPTHLPDDYTRLQQLHGHCFEPHWSASFRHPSFKRKKLSECLSSNLNLGNSLSFCSNSARGKDVILRGK